MRDAGCRSTGLRENSGRDDEIEESNRGHFLIEAGTIKMVYFRKVKNSSLIKPACLVSKTLEELSDETPRIISRYLLSIRASHHKLAHFHSKKLDSRPVFFSFVSRLQQPPHVGFCHVLPLHQ